MALKKAVLAIDVRPEAAILALFKSAGEMAAIHTLALGQRRRWGQIVPAIEQIRSSGNRSDLPQAIGVSISDAAFDHRAAGLDDLRKTLQQRTGVPVAVENARSCWVMGEAHGHRGAAKGKSNIVAFIADATISAGIISSGQVVRGAHGRAGSAAWMTVTLADCLEVRQFGCLEAYASAPGLVRTAKAAIDAGFGGAMAAIGPENLTAENIAQLARKGDVSAKEVFRRVARLLGLGIANLISLFDPEVVVFGGELADISDCFWDDMKRTAFERCEPFTARKARIVLSKLGNDARLYGAAQFALSAAGVATRLRTTGN